jgi:hypothetical protein
VRTIFALGVLLVVLPVASRADAPRVEDILRNLIERSTDPVSESRRNSFSYQRTSRVEYLNDDGTRKRDTIRIFEITPENGRPVTRLISVNGRPAQDREDKRKSAARETGEKSRMLALNEELLSRFHFTFLREEVFASRPAWVLTFVPKANAPNSDFMDRLINSVCGTFWIDQEDYQLARADVQLSKRVSFFGGIAGAIDKLDLTLIQRRVETSVWLGEAIHIDFAGRKLLSSIRFRAFENCANFEPAPKQHARAE